MFIRRRTLLTTAIAAPFMAGCATSMAWNADPMAPLPRDTSSHARPDEARVRHVSLDRRCS